jgi:cytochrome c553
VKRQILVLLLGLGVVGSIIVVSGVTPITASSGHWSITERFLGFAMRRSVATHSLGIEVPPLDDPDLVLRGATHYEVGCRSCHGSPGMRPPRIPRAMTPHPPDLISVVRERRARELFYVVKHGVKFTGMPAWPAQQRDDEVWSVVAFLQKLPDLDEHAYQGLIGGELPATAPIESLGGARAVPEAPPRAAAEMCARCHGVDGVGRDGAFPRLAGQRREYLQRALEAYASGERHSGTMEPIAAGLGAEQLRELARHYSELAPPSPDIGNEPDLAAIDRGRTIAHDGVPAQRVPSCVDCHAQQGTRPQGAYPTLAAQPADYIVLQLELFARGHRGGSDHAHLMQAVAPRLTPQQMRDVALFFESLTPP